MKKYGARPALLVASTKDPYAWRSIRQLALDRARDAGSAAHRRARARHGAALARPGADVGAGGLVQANATMITLEPYPTMKLESVVYAVAGVFFGLITGWIIGSQQAPSRRGAGRRRRRAPPPAPASASGWTPLEHARPGDSRSRRRCRRCRRWPRSDPKNAVARAQLGDLYYDAGRYPDAIKWYGESLALNPKDVDVSTDLGVSYYYNNETDRAIQQLEHSLAARSDARQDAAEPRRREGLRQAGFEGRDRSLEEAGRGRAAEPGRTAGQAGARQPVIGPRKPVGQ